MAALAAAVAFLAPGCAADRAAPPGVAALADGRGETAEYVGAVFRVLPPFGEGWRRVESGSNRIVYAVSGLRDRTFELSVTAWEEPWPIATQDEFLRFATARHTQMYVADRPRVARSHFEPVTNYSRLCIRWDVEGLPMQGGWVVHSFGYEIRHPERPDYFVRSMFRQVSYRSEYDKGRVLEAEQFFKRLELR